MRGEGYVRDSVDLAINTYWWIGGYIHANQRPPTRREIRAAMGMSSLSVVNYYLEKLRDWGWLDWQFHKPRTIRMTNRVGIAIFPPEDVAAVFESVKALEWRRLAQMALEARRLKSTVSATG